MKHPRYTTEEIVRRGEALYEQQIRSQVESANIGKYIAIDIETGGYEIGDNYHALSRRILGQRPDAALCVLRIGYLAAGRIGGRSQVARR